MRIWHTHQKGLTLLETLVTVAVIAVIAVISVPTVGNIIPATQDRTVQEAQNTVDEFVSKWNDSGAYTFDPTTATWAGYADVNGNGIADEGEEIESIDLNEEQYTIAPETGDAPTTRSEIDFDVTPHESFTIGGATSTAAGVLPVYDSITFTYLTTSFTFESDNQQLSPTISGGASDKTYTFTGTLPTGVTFDEATGVFTGPEDSAWNFQVTQVSSGDRHTCAVTTTGGAKCWGWGEFGRLGNDSTTDSLTPVDVHTSDTDATPLDGVTAINASTNHTCAVVNGGAKCWGWNGMGQLGNGTSTDSFTPVDVVTSDTDATPLDGVSAISATDNHTCAIVDDGAKCWGWGGGGQLGEGSTQDRYHPVDVRTSASDPSPLADVTSISTGDTHTCAVADGIAKCWGWNGQGRLGTGDTSARTSPVNVHTSDTDATPLDGVTSISAGDISTCAVVNGGAKCWGWNGMGQLGNGTSTDSFTPVDVVTSDTDATPLDGVSAISVNRNHTCAIVNDGAKCWGWGGGGQLGENAVTDRYHPVDVRTSPSDANALSGVTGISVHDSHTCAIADGGVKCWGWGGDGRLGNGDTAARLSPVNVVDSGPQPGFPATVDVTVSDESGTETRTVTLSVN